MDRVLVEKNVKPNNIKNIEMLAGKIVISFVARIPIAKAMDPNPPRSPPLGKKKPSLIFKVC